MKLAERTCGNCAWFKPRPQEANHDVPHGLCQYEPQTVDKSADERCSHHDTVDEADSYFRGHYGLHNLVAPGGDVMLGVAPEYTPVTPALIDLINNGLESKGDQPAPVAAPPQNLVERSASDPPFSDPLLG